MVMLSVKQSELMELDEAEDEADVLVEEDGGMRMGTFFPTVGWNVTSVTAFTLWEGLESMY